MYNILGYVCNTFNVSDINECQVRTDNCHTNALCTDTIGSFRCDCQIGYYGDGANCSSKLSKDLNCFWLTLINQLDLDECDINTDDCHDNATCTDTDGSYKCTCNTGYEGDGMDCLSKQYFVCDFSPLELHK